MPSRINTRGVNTREMFRSFFHRDRVQMAAGHLLEAFTWRESVQGDEYWREVHENLLQIYNMPERTILTEHTLGDIPFPDRAL